MSQQENLFPETEIPDRNEIVFKYSLEGINEDTKDIEDETETGNSLKEIQTNNYISADGGIWRKRKNYYGRIIELKKERVIVDCLIDPRNREFEEREFLRMLFENINDLSAGKYVIIRIFIREGKSQITIDDATKLVDRNLFEDDSQFADLKDVENPPISIDKL